MIQYLSIREFSFWSGYFKWDNDNSIWIIDTHTYTPGVYTHIGFLFFLVDQYLYADH